MPEVFGIDHRWFAVGTVAVSVGVSAYAAYRMGLKHGACAKKQGNVYEAEKAFQEYMAFHYGAPHEVLSYDFGPKDALGFPKRCAEFCIKHFKQQDGVPNRALDIGCAVGRATFELTRQFSEVVGIDYSHSFVKACQTLKEKGELDYCVTIEGDLTKPLKAVVDPDLDRSKTTFQQGDACALPSEIGKFGCVLAANLIDRVVTPKDFLARMADLIAPGGILVILSPYTYLREFTPRENWIGGFRTVDGLEGLAFDGLRVCLQNDFELVEEKEFPFLIRETAHKNQWTVSHGSVWRRLA